MVGFDFLIVGQGIAGSTLAAELMDGGANVLMLDNNIENTASRRAAAVIHPYSAEDLSLSEKAKKYLDVALLHFKNIEQESSKIFLLPSQLNIWGDTAAISKTNSSYPSFASPPKHILQKAWLIRTAEALQAYQQLLQSKKCYQSAAFKFSNLKLKKGEISYGDFQAKKIIFCEGADAKSNPLFAGAFPFTQNRGDVLTVEIPELSRFLAREEGIQNIFEKNGIRLIPLGNGKFWCGSNNIWELDDLIPSKNFKVKTLELLGNWLCVPFQIIQHTATERPTTAGQFPLVGLLPQHTEIGIFNGLGTRGFLRAPYYAKAMATSLLSQKQRIKDYDNERFWKLAQHIGG